MVWWRFYVSCLSVLYRHGWRCLWILRIPSSYRHLKTWGLPVPSRPQRSEMKPLEGARRGNSSLQSSAQGCQMRMFEVCTSGWNLSCFQDNDCKHADSSLRRNFTWKSHRTVGKKAPLPAWTTLNSPQCHFLTFYKNRIWQHWFRACRKVTVWPPAWCAGHPWMWDVKLIRLVLLMLLNIWLLRFNNICGIWCCSFKSHCLSCSVLEMLSFSKFSDLETWLCMPSSLLLPGTLESSCTSSSSSSSSHASGLSSRPVSSSSLPTTDCRRSTYSEPAEGDTIFRSVSNIQTGLKVFVMLVQHVML